jgi:hypothetical protein
MFKITKTSTVTFFMKSGNKVLADKVVVPFTATHRGNVVVMIESWRQLKGAKNILMLSTLDLSQIEAITFT